MQQSVASAQSFADIVRIEADVSPNRRAKLVRKLLSGNATIAMASAFARLVKGLIRISK